MSVPEAITLDLDETLLDLRGLSDAIESTCRAVATASKLLHVEKVRLANALIWEQEWARVEMDWALGRLSGADLTRDVWSKTLEACGVDDAGLVDFATATHLDIYRNCLRLYPDARALLDTLVATGLPTALITNGASDTQREKLRVLGIEDVFASVVISGELGVAKPDPRPFHVATDALGVDGRAVWHVGDSLSSDVAGARTAGLTSVWINRNGGARPDRSPAPDMEVRSLAQLAGRFRGGES